jgi:hypothetical protein
MFMTVCSHPIPKLQKHCQIPFGRLLKVPMLDFRSPEKHIHTPESRGSILYRTLTKLPYLISREV